MKKKRIIIVLAVIFVVIGILIGTYFYGLTPVSKTSQEIEFKINSGTGKMDIIDDLKEAGLIKSKFAGYIYMGLHRNLNIQAGRYSLNTNMGVEKIIKKFHDGDIIEEKNPNVYTLTFVEGKRLTDYIEVIAEATSTTKKDVEAVLNDKKYLKELIDKYWFLTDDILNSKLFNPLEGYLFASTYELYKGSDIKTIIEKMLDGTNSVLTLFKEEIEASKYSVHEILTLASIIQNEGKTRDFQNISSVFHNRLNIGMKLQSCATSYYGVRKDFSSVGIATYEYTSNQNDYNTYYVSGLPIGPISSPSKKAIEAALHPNETENLFFLSDNEGVTYFFKTYSEHQKKEAELKQAGKWAR